MAIAIELNGKKRKALVEAISKHLKVEAVYKGAPSYAYEIGAVTLDRAGGLSVDGPDVEVTVALLEALHSAGFGVGGREPTPEQTTLSESEPTATGLEATDEAQSETPADAICAGHPADDGVDVQQRAAELQSEMMELIKKGVGKDKEQRDAEFQAIADEISTLRNQQEAQDSVQASAENRRSRMNEIIAVLEGHDFCLEEYDDGLVRQMVERVRVLDGDKVAVKFAELGTEYVCGLRDGSMN